MTGRRDNKFTIYPTPMIKRLLGDVAKNYSMSISATSMLLWEEPLIEEYPHLEADIRAEFEKIKNTKQGIRSDV